CMGSLLEFAYLPTIYPGLAHRYPTLRFLTTSSPVPVDLGTLQVKILFGLFGFFAVAYLSSYLVENLREAGAELRDKSGQVASLEAIKENIIHSLRSGLITTDLAGAITELNPAGAALLGRDHSEPKGKNIAAVFPMVETGLLMPDGMAADPAAASAAPAGPSS